ncbi:MAG: putative sporulation protein YtxC [Clostridia bacterium]|nr:putative sporulation protein YtxC [Clostridia bacterium]
MQSYCLEITDDKDGFLHILKDRISAGNYAERFDCNWFFYDNTSRVVFCFNDSSLYKKFVRILADTLLEIIESAMLIKTVNLNCFYFTEKEKKRIASDAKNIFNGEQQPNSSIDIRKKRKEYIYNRLHEYMGKNDKLILDGFIRFRLKEIIDQIEDSVEKAADDFIIEKEYNEFIKLLRYFVEIQEPKIDEVHVILDSNSNYVLLDSDMKAINNDLLKDLAKEISNNEISGDDLLISSLITIAPNKITIHSDKKNGNKEVLNTIKNVFYGKVDIDDNEGNNYLCSLTEKKK